MTSYYNYYKSLCILKSLKKSCQVEFRKKKSYCKAHLKLFLNKFNIFLKVLCNKNDYYLYSIYKISMIVKVRNFVNFIVK